MKLKDKYVLLNVNVVDGYGGEAELDMFVKIEWQLITDVGKMKKYRKEDGVQEVDLNGQYVMPGMIDAHVHLAGGRGTGEYADTEIISESKLLRGMRSVYEAQQILKRGFTSVRDISWNGLYLKRIFGDYIMPGPRIIACGPGLARTGGHCDTYQFTEEYVQANHQWAVLADGPDECRKWVRRILREGADQIKFWACGGDNYPTDRAMDRHYSFEEMKTIVEEAHMIKGTMVCSHAETLETIKMSIEAGTDTIEHGEDIDEECADKMKDRGIILVPTLLLLNDDYYTNCEEKVDIDQKMIRPHAFLHREADNWLTGKKKEATKRYIKRLKETFDLAKEKGVKIALGSDTVYEPATPYGEYSAGEFRTLVEFGMTVPEAIKAATLTAAEALGMSHRIGTVEPGKNADLLVVKEEPTSAVDVLYNSENIRMVISNGLLVVEEGRMTF